MTTEEFKNLKIGDRVIYNNIVDNLHGKIIHVDPDQASDYAFSVVIEFEPKRPTRTLRLKANASIQLTLDQSMPYKSFLDVMSKVTCSVGDKVIIKPLDNPSDVGYEFGGQVGTIVEVSKLFSFTDSHEIELGADANFQRLLCTADQFELYLPHSQSSIPAVAEERKRDGLCPKCGEKGYFSHLVLICSRHGEY